MGKYSLHAEPYSEVEGTKRSVPFRKKKKATVSLIASHHSVICTDPFNFFFLRCLLVINERSA